MNLIAIYKKTVILCLMMCLCQVHAQAQKWTYADTVFVEGKTVRCYLSIPLGIKYIRGLVIAVDNFAENLFVEDSALRAVAAEQELAIMYTFPKLMVPFDTAKGHDVVFQLALQKLAKLSGFPEVEHAPFITFGHSVAEAFAKDLAYWRPSRAAGVIVYKAGGINTGNWPDSRVILDVPLLTVSGQYEEIGGGGTLENPGIINKWRSIMGNLMQARPKGHLMSSILDVGAGHYTFNKRTGAYIADFIRAVAERRIPHDTIAKKGPIQLNKLSEESGWLTDTAVYAPAAHAPAPYQAYTGNKAAAMWHADSTLARAWVAYHNQDYNRKHQNLRFQEGSPSYSGGMEFMFGVPAGPFVRTATAPNGGEIKYKVIRGAAVQIADNNFKTVPYAENPERVYVLAYQEGDDVYQYSEKVCWFRVAPLPTASSTDISVEPITDKRVGDPPFQIMATSASGETIMHDVAYGPALINGNTITVTDYANGNFPNDTAYVMIRSANTKATKETVFKVHGSIISGNTPPIKSAKLDIFPNPAHAVVHIQTAGLSAPNVQLMIRDLAGKALLTQTLSDKPTNGTLALDISALPSGVYWVEMNAGWARRVGKMVKY